MDGKWLVPVSSATVFLVVGGATQDFAVTESDGRFHLRAAVRTPETAVPFEIEAHHPDYMVGRVSLTVTAPPPPAPGAFLAGVPLWVIAAAGAAIAAAIALLLAVRKARSAEALTEAGEWLES